MNQQTQLPTVTPISHDATLNEHTVPFAVFEKNHIDTPDQPTDWLWELRIPKGGFTLLDGDHRTGRSFLSLLIAACVSSGSPMPDGTPTTAGGVVIITPSVDARKTQFPFLASQGANLRNIEFLSYVHDPETASHPSGYRPFAFPQDLSRLLASIERVNAQLIILDPFIELLSHDRRWTDRRLADLLDELNQHLIARNIACLLIRDCPAKGGHAKPSVLERSKHFENIAMSRLLVAHDPFQSASLLLTHAKSFQTDPIPTLTLHLQKNTSDPRLPSLTFHGTHTLQASDFMTYRSDVLHRLLLSDHLLQLITAADKPIHVSTLSDQSPPTRSLSFQIQRALKDLLNRGKIQRLARGFYSLTPADPVFTAHPSDSDEAEAKSREFLEDMLCKIAQDVSPSDRERVIAHIKASLQYDDPTIPTTAKFARFMRGDYDFPQDVEILSHDDPAPANPKASLDVTPATTPITEQVPNLNTPAATTLIPEQAPNFNSSAATTLVTEQAPNPHLTFWTDDRVREKAWRETYLDNPYPTSIEEQRRVYAAYRRFVDSLDPNRTP